MDSHPEIPVGLYCYRLLEVTKDENGRTRLKTEVCPHWQKTENGARCDLLDREDHTYCGFHLIWDRVKECGINEGRGEDYKPQTSEQAAEQCKREGFELKTITCECGKEMEIWEKNRSKES